jgi:hypothetical protein
MKKIFILAAMVLSLTSPAQNFIQGSIQQGAAVNQVNILFLPNYTSAAGEYVNYLSISIAIPLSSAAGVTPSITMTGAFTGMSLTPAIPFSYTAGSEKIFSWVYSTGPSTMSWTIGVPFTGATISFSGGLGTSKVRLVDFTNYSPSGGDNSNTYFLVVTNKSPFDVTNYSNLFYSIAGLNGSTTGTYANGDQYVETNLSIPLPVGLLNFSGYKQGNKNELRWTTVSENNNLGFEVQRSLNGVDYTAIGFVYSLAARGTSNTALHYLFEDIKPLGTKQYYRLKQVDIDGRGKLTSIITIKGENPSGLFVEALYPNPAREQINLIISAQKKQELDILITDQGGRLIVQKKAVIEQGSNAVTLDLSKLSAGNYVVKLLCNDGCEKISGKFVKL